MIFRSSETASYPTSQSLDITSIRRATVTIAILRTRSRGTSGGGVLLLAPGAEPVLLGLLLSAHFDIAWGGVAGESVHETGRLGDVLLAAPPLAAGAVGVVVGGRGPEALLALVVAGQQDLEEDGDEEEEARVDGLLVRGGGGGDEGLDLCTVLTFR